MAKYVLNHKADLIKRTPAQNELVFRGDELTLPGTVDGIYNQLLFDLCGDNDLLSLTLLGAYNRALDAIGFLTSDVQHIHEDMIVYVSADGAAAGEETSGRQTDPCAAGNAVEAGGCVYELTGWGRLRRTSEVRDVTDVMEKYCMQQPIYDIGGNRIANDYEWDVIRLGTVILHDFQREVVIGNSATGGSHDGLELTVVYGYTNPDTQEVCTSMDSTVVDWNGNAICPTNGANGVTVNGVLITDGYRLTDILKSFLRRTAQRVRMSSLSGAPLHIGLAPTETINCLISCYVCDIVCGGDVERMDSFEAREMMARLRQEFGTASAVMLSFDGYPVLIYAYDWELYDSVTDRSDMYILTPTVGNTPLMRFHTKDMSKALTITEKSGTQFNVTDQNRFLHWESWDHTCYTVSLEMQWRLYCPAPWAQMRITNIACDTPLGQISGDPLSAVYIETNLQAFPAA
jgi:hypothetical protein